jgi:hypothetical protein
MVVQQMPPQTTAQREELRLSVLSSLLLAAELVQVRLVGLGEVLTQVIL